MVLFLSSSTASSAYLLIRVGLLRPGIAAESNVILSRHLSSPGWLIESSILEDIFLQPTKDAPRISAGMLSVQKILLITASAPVTYHTRSVSSGESSSTFAAGSKTLEANSGTASNSSVGSFEISSTSKDAWKFSGSADSLPLG